VPLLILARSVPLTAEPRLPAATAVPESTTVPVTLPLRPVANAVTVHFPAAAAPTLLPDGELRFLAFRHVSFRPRQRGAYQPPVHWSFVFRRDGFVARFVGHGVAGARGHRDGRVVLRSGRCGQRFGL
jgi:hypothetical protein